MTQCSSTCVEELVAVFSLIEQQRMQDVPILNSALNVEAIGFVPWNGYELGVLITPWFMNLMLLGEGDAPESEAGLLGDKIRHCFPSGLYEFILAEEPGIGRYQACSLFSPMHPFHSHALAVETAQMVMQSIMMAENRSEISTHSHEIERVWRGEGSEQPNEVTDQQAEVEDSVSLTERLEMPLSRREILTGLFSEK
jgi:[NiFe] hydrogenase assembly HybE family chaperone